MMKNVNEMKCKMKRFNQKWLLHDLRPIFSCFSQIYSRALSVLWRTESTECLYVIYTSIHYLLRYKKRQNITKCGVAPIIYILFFYSNTVVFPYWQNWCFWPAQFKPSSLCFLCIFLWLVQVHTHKQKD